MPTGLTAISGLGRFLSAWLPAVVVSVTLGGLGLGAAGCASRPHANPSADKSASDYVALYFSGQYQAAFEASSDMAASMRATDRTRASLIAGLSAQALDRDGDARKFLTPLLNDADDAISGKAAAALGLIALQHGEHAAAAELLSTASKRLINDDKARAAMYAGDSFRAIGKLDEAKKHYQLAQATIREDSALKLLVGDRLATLKKQANTPKPTQPSPIPPRAAQTASRPSVPQNPPSHKGADPASPTAQARPSGFEFQGPVLTWNRTSTFSVQAGVFATWNAAVTKSTQLKRFGTARIVEIRDMFGRRLYAVRLGNCGTMNAAEELRSRVGQSAVVVPMER